MTGTGFEADRAAGAPIVQVAVTPAGPELLDRLLGTGRVALIALEAVAAGQAASGFKPGGGLAQPGLDFRETGRAISRRNHRLYARLGVAVDRQVQHIEGDDRRPLRRGDIVGAQPGVDPPRGGLPVADRRRDGPGARRHVAAGENPGMTGHHLLIEGERAV